MRQTHLKDLFPVTVLHLERCLFLARSNRAKNVEWYDSEFKQSSWLFEKEKWRTRICLDVSASTLNAEDEAWTKAFHHHHRVTLTDAHLEGCRYTSFGCTVFDHEIHILWALSHLEEIKGFIDGSLRPIKTRHVHQTPSK